MVAYEEEESELCQRDAHAMHNINKYASKLLCTWIGAPAREATRRQPDQGERWGEAKVQEKKNCRNKGMYSTAINTIHAKHTDARETSADLHL